MSVVKTVGRGIAWNTTASILGKFIMFANVFLVLNFLTVYEYGFSELVLSVISVIGIVLLPGLTNTILADLAVEKGRSNPSGMKMVFHQFIFLNLSLAFVAWAVLFFGSHPVARAFGNPYAAQFLQIASFLFLISPIRSATTMLAAVMLRFFDQSFYTIFEELAKLALLLVLVVWLQLGVRGLMYAMVLSQLIVVICFIPRTLSAYRYFASAPAIGHLHFWNAVRDHRKWSIGTAYIGTLGQNTRIWIIKFLLGTEAVAMYAFASGMFSHIASLMPLTAVLTPIIPRYIDKRDQLARILRASIKFQVAVSVVFLFVAYLTSYFFVHLVFPKYIAAIPLLYVILLTLLPNGVLSLFTPVFNAFKEQRSFLAATILKFFMTLIILPPSIYLFGLIGPGVEIFLTTLGSGIERSVRLRRLLPEFNFRIRTLLHPDAYEQEAMRTVLRTIRSRLPVWGNSENTRA